jgi:hypothetical protein|nr:MAG TPA: hypothetical protein [Caudoviricetes sp.]
MKEFNLDAALNGEPVKLACGRKAYILYDLSRYPKLLKHTNRRPLNGLVMSGYMENDCYLASWLSDGKNSFDENNIIGMWEEPKISIEDLPKPFKPKDGEPYFYITGGIVEYEDDYWDSNKFDKSSAERGGCYRTREDAQKWLDFMKSMME